MKKVISLLLCVVMLLGIVPLTAGASEQVEFVRIEMRLPFAGQEIRFDPDVSPSDEVELDTDYFSEGVYDGVKWMDESGMHMPEGTTLEEGKEYTVRIYIRPKRGYVFNRGEVCYCVFDDFDQMSRSMVQDDIDYYYVDHTFTCTKEPQYNVINQIDLTGTAPVAGQKPSYDVYWEADYYDIDLSYEENGFHRGARWQNMNSLEFLGENDTFESGVPYRISVMMIAGSGYAMKYDEDYNCDTVITFNGVAGGQSQGDEGYAKKFMISYDFGKRTDDEDKVIDSVSLTGPVAKAGQKPSYDVKVPDGAPYYVNKAINDNGYYVNGVAWFRVEDLNFVMPNETFKAGYTYRVLVHLNTEPGYVFPANEIDEDYYQTDLVPTYNGSDGWFGGINPYAAHFGWQTTLIADIGDAKTTGVKLSMPYTGKAVKQNLKITYGGRELFEGSDYTLSYKNNVKIGKATMTIKGIGNFKGTYSFNFKIELAKPKVTVSKVTADTVTLKWNKVTGAKYYTVYQYNTKTKKYTGVYLKTTGTSFTHKKRTAGTTYYYLVRAFGTDSAGKTVGSPYTVKDCVKAITLCKAPRVSSRVYRIGTTKNRGVQLIWNKCTGAKSYKIYKYNTKTKKYTAVLTTTGTSAKLGMHRKGTYHYLVRAFNANGEGSAYTLRNNIKVIVK